MKTKIFLFAAFVQLCFVACDQFFIYELPPPNQVKIAVVFTEGASNNNGGFGISDSLPANLQIGLDRVLTVHGNPSNLQSVRIKKYHTQQNSNFHSTNKRFGVELGIALKLRAVFDTVVIVKHYVGGAGVAPHPVSADFYPIPSGVDTGEAFVEMMAYYRNAAKLIESRWRGQRYENVGYVWVHGESDACPETIAKKYSDYMGIVMDSLRTNFDGIGKTSRPPLLVVTEAVKAAPPCDYEPMNISQQFWAGKDINGRFLPAKNPTFAPDGIHFSWQYLLQLGHEAGDALIP